MRLFWKSFDLIGRGKLWYSTEDGKDTVIIDVDDAAYLDLFFEMNNAFVPGKWHDDIQYRVFEWDDYAVCFSFCGHSIPKEVTIYDMKDFMVYKGYYLVLYEFRSGFHKGTDYWLGVAAMDDLHFVGSISAACGGESTPELSRLIMSAPEINWGI